MKKIKIIGICTLMVLILCACGKSEEVKNVEKLISNIGTVSLSSEKSISEAENAYNSLTDEDKGKVKNYSKLENAKKELSELGIVLNIDNYEKYLNVNMDPKLIDGVDIGIISGLGKSVGSTVFTGIESNVSVSGKSNNYDYNDVVVTARYTGWYVPLDNNVSISEEWLKDNMVDIDVTLKAEADIVGRGSDTNIIKAPEGKFFNSAGVEIHYEIVDVSGVMTPVK